MANEFYSVDLAKADMVFSAAHFITFGGNVCERIHGHNYRVDAEVRGQLDENYYVIDFIALRDSLRKQVDAWDHHVLLPTRHQTIRVRRAGGEVIATFEDRRWVFPEGDCILLDVENTTAELLAREIGKQLLDVVAQLEVVGLTEIRVGVDENNGQWGRWHHVFDQR